MASLYALLLLNTCGCRHISTSILSTLHFREFNFKSSVHGTCTLLCIERSIDEWTLYVLKSLLCMGTEVSLLISQLVLIKALLLHRIQPYFFACKKNHLASNALLFGCHNWIAQTSVGVSPRSETGPSVHGDEGLGARLIRFFILVSWTYLIDLKFGKNLQAGWAIILTHTPGQISQKEVVQGVTGTYMYYIFWHNSWMLATTFCYAGIIVSRPTWCTWANLLRERLYCTDTIFNSGGFITRS